MGRLLRRLLILLAAGSLATANLGVPSASAYNATGSWYWTLFGSDTTWLTWNSTTSTQTVAGVVLPARSVQLDSQKAANPNNCVDAVWDWKLWHPVDPNPHYDARVLRYCASGIWTWVKTEPAPGINYSFIGENKHGACYLTDPTTTGRLGSNLSGIQRSYGCVGYVISGTLNSVQAGYPTSPAAPVCADAKIIWGATVLTLTSANPRSCSS